MDNISNKDKQILRLMVGAVQSVSAMGLIEGPDHFRKIYTIFLADGISMLARMARRECRIKPHESVAEVMVKANEILGKTVQGDPPCTVAMQVVGEDK